MPGLHADTAAMNINGRDTVANAEYLEQELSSLGANIEGLMTLWRGLSANEFNSSYEEQAVNFNAFRILLNDLGESISAAANILNKTEEENASAGSRLF